jgi:hypothetical protein
MPFYLMKRFGAVSDIPSDHGAVVSLTADTADDVVGASTVAVGGAGGHSGGTSRFDALAPPQLVAATSAMAAIDDEARPRVRVWRGGAGSMVS